MKPERVTGSSAGAILTAALAYGLADHEIKSVLLELKRKHFWDPAFGLGLLKGERLQGLVREILQGHRQILPISISTFDILKRKTKSFERSETDISEQSETNISWQVNIARFVRASCALPLMFHPVQIEGRRYWDGGVLDKLALDSVKQGERVLVHGLPSQGVHQLVEGRSDFGKIGRKYFVIAPQDLPAVGPYALEKGPEAIGQAYQNALRALPASN